MSSLKEFTKSFYYDRDVKEALDMVYEKLREQPAGCAAAFEADELEHFFKLCGDLARYNPGEEQKILNMARTMMGGLAAWSMRKSIYLCCPEWSAMDCSCVSLENFQKKYWIRPVKKSKIWACKRSSARKKPRRSRGNWFKFQNLQNCIRPCAHME